jgi:hypothetical protein
LVNTTRFAKDKICQAFAPFVATLAEQKKTEKVSASRRYETRDRDRADCSNSAQLERWPISQVFQGQGITKSDREKVFKLERLLPPSIKTRRRFQFAFGQPPPGSLASRLSTQQAVGYRVLNVPVTNNSYPYEVPHATT